MSSNSYHPVKCNNAYEFIINELLKDPTVEHKTLAEMFGYTPAWMSRIIGSDSFQARLAQRRCELLDPDIRARIDDRMKSVVLQSMELVQRKLDSAEASADMALAALGVASRAMGMLNGKA